MPSSQSVPLEWPAAWREPENLKLLQDTPFNCLLLPEQTPPALRQAAEARGLECPAGVAWTKWEDADWNGSGPLIAISDGVWPQLALKAGKAGADAVQAGPTGEPWLDANGWLLELARARAGGKSVWIKSDPPTGAKDMLYTSYVLAHGEAEAYGARRPLWLAPDLAAEMARGSATAERDWRRIARAAAWHAAHRDWAAWPPFARLLIVSDFDGANRDTAGEVLNLSARRGVEFVPAERSRCVAGALASKRAVLYVDPEPMPESMAATVQKFVEEGGLLLCLKAPAAAVRRAVPAKEQHPRFDLFNCGKGRLAVSKADWGDTFVLAQDAHLLMSRRHDSVRLFNAGSIVAYHTSSPDQTRWLVHLLNYSTNAPAHMVSLQTWRSVASARVHLPDKGAPDVLEIHRETGYQEVYLPAFPVYCAVELELTSHA